MPDIAHLAFPIRLVDGVAATVEQDSPDHKQQRIEVVCLAPLGDRLADPEFGIPSDLLSVRRVDLDVLAAALASSEPDIAVNVSRVTAGNPDPPGFPLPGARDDSVRIDVLDG